MFYAKHKKVYDSEEKSTRAMREYITLLRESQPGWKDHQ